MKRISIQSRLIQSIAHDSKTGALHVWFRNGKHRIHQNVSAEIVENLISAESPGFYYSYSLYEPASLAERSHIWKPSFLAVVTLAMLMLPI